jgi:WW domain-binding protein 4
MSSGNKRKESWRRAERHYCAVCNTWMGGDRQSIALHDNGKKHTENVQQAMLQKRADRATEENKEKALQQSLQAMEAAALQAHAGDLGLFATTHHPPLYAQPVAQFRAVPPMAPQSNRVPPPPPPPPASSKHNKKQEMQDWEAKRQAREEEKLKKRGLGEDDEDDEDDEEEDPRLRKKPKIGEQDGHYTHEGHTYLEAIVFGDMLEEDMPLEIWTGSLLASLAEKRLPERHVHWQWGLVAAVRQKLSAVDHEDRLVVDVAYLRDPDDAQETLQKSVPLNRVRLVLGKGDAADDMIPATLVEARIMAMGGEEEIVPESGDGSQQPPEEMDEATGFTSWATVSIKKTTIHQELKEERARLRHKRKEDAEQADRVKREADARRMEEAKVANADDSALGAYDVYSRSKEGYKGVDIHGEAKVDVHDLGKKLSEGKTDVGFKKSAFKSKKKKQNRRTTSADDD